MKIFKLLKNQKGNLLLEVLITLAILGIIISSVTAFPYLLIRSSIELKKRNEAISLSKSFLEDLRFIQYEDWTKFSGLNFNQSYKINKTSTDFEILTGVENSGDFQREIIFSEVYRDVNGNVSSSGTLDADTLKATVNVYWTNFSKNKSFSLSTYLSSWYSEVTCVASSYLENFDAGNLNNWSGDTNRWSVINYNGNNVAYNSRNNQTTINYGDLAWTDYTVTARMNIRTYRLHGLLFRYQDSSNYLGLKFSNNQVSLERVLNNSSSIISGSTSVPFSPQTNVWYVLKVEVIGDQIKAKWWQEGTSEPANWLISGTDSSLLSGKVGLTNRQSARYDDISIETICP